MNKHLETFRSLTSLAISGDRHSGKLTLALYFASQLTKKPVTLISPFSKTFLEKKINSILQLESNLQSVLQHIVPLNLKEDWKSLKNDFGYSFLLKDIEKINTAAEEVIIFHRIDEFFEIQDSNDIENFLFNLITIAQIEEKTLIFTINTAHESAGFIYQYFEKNVDTELSISKSAYDASLRDVEIVSSLFTSQQSSFSFGLNKTTHCFDLLPQKRKEERNEPENKAYQIVLASQSSEMANVASYLFDGDRFSVTRIEPTLSQMIKEVMNDRADVIIFNPSPKQLPAELKKISKVISNSDKKVIFIPSKPFQRSLDKAQIAKSVFFDIQDKNFHVEDFVISVERALNYPFYSHEMKKIPKKTYITHDQKTFGRFIAALLCKNLFFTVFKFKYQPPLSERELKTNLGRPFDVAFIKKDEQVLLLFLVNTLVRNAPAIESKMNQVNPGIKLIGLKDATKYSKEHNNQVNQESRQ